jgi:Tn7-like transposition protein D
LTPGFASLAQTYRRLLAEKGLATTSGLRIVNMTNLVDSFKEFYGEDILQQTGCEIRAEISDNSWFDQILQNRQRMCNPLYHLLLIRFLGYSGRCCMKGGLRGAM